jgi:CRP/FNR family cyclic AMP-dependent transcriptional regulator
MPRMDAERLKSVPPFDGLPDDVREKFAVWVGEQKVDAGRTLAEQGEYAYELFVIEDGTAEVHQNGEKIAELGPGEFFGEMGVLEGKQRNATVVAATPMKLFTLSHWDVKRLERQAPDAVGRLRDVIEQRRGGS